MEMTVSQVAHAAQATVVAGAQSRGDLVVGVTWDSRTVKPGMLYVALPGERVDGHDYVEAAVRAGAKAALVMRDLPAEVLAAAQEAGAAVLRVEDTQAAFTRLAAEWRWMQYGLVVGLTGSTGKTSTKNLVRDVLCERMRVVATQANQNNELGVPNTLLAATNEHVVVVEMGMRGPGQITELCKIAQPEWGIVTNAGESHIELLGSRDNIIRAKAELFAALPSNGLAFVNAADDSAPKLIEYGQLKSRGVTIVCFDGFSNARPALLDEPGNGDVPFVWATDIRLDEQGRPSFTLNASNVPAVSGEVGTDVDPLWVTSGAIECHMELRGLHNVSNACSAVAVGLAAGMKLEECARGLAKAQPEEGRQQVLHASNGVIVVNDAYNANPDSMRASLSTFSAMQVPGRRIAVLGDMLELGDFSRECHERVGRFAAEAHLDELLCVGELSADMAAAAAAAGMDPAHIARFASAREALDALLPLVAAGDAVLVKASHSIGLQEVAEGLVS